ASASEAERVAPGYIIKFRVALKGRNTGDISALQAFTSRALSQPRGDAPRFARACPWLSHCAPSALSSDFCAKPTGGTTQCPKHLSTNILHNVGIRSFVQR